MQTHERELLVERIIKMVGIITALQWNRDVEHMDYSTARSEIRRRLGKLGT